jgi:RHS repeat-associated protein
LSEILTESDWENATPVTAGLPENPVEPGQVEGMTITGLSPEETYYFAVRARDEAANLGGLSNSPGAQPLAVLPEETPTAEPDTTSPSAITDLAAATGSEVGAVDLTWTAPGDDGVTGVVQSYDVRYSLSEILTESDWENATPVTAGLPESPVESGQVEGMTVTGLFPEETYYFAVRAQDEAANLGGLSNSPGAQPLAPFPYPLPADVQLAFVTFGVLHASDYAGLYPLPYRGWTSAGYNGNRERATQPISQADLSYTENKLKGYASSEDGFYGDARYDPAKEKAHPFFPAPNDNMWRGPDDLVWVMPGQMSSSRLGADDINIMNPEISDSAFAVTKRSSSFNLSLGIGALGAAYSEILDGYSTNELDYLDMNGDQFPDIVSSQQVLYTFPQGWIDTDQQKGGGMLPGEDVRETSAGGRNFGMGATAALNLGGAEGKHGASSKKSSNSNQSDNQKVELGFGGDFGFDDSKVISDLIDINGDGLPDRVFLGFGYAFADNDKDGFPEAAADVNCDGLPEIVKIADVNGDGILTNEDKNDQGFFDLEADINGNGVFEIVSDINCDGIPDYATETALISDLDGDGTFDIISGITSITLKVMLNLGYEFGEPEPWGEAVINRESAHQFGLNLGFNTGIYDFAGGVAFSDKESNVSQTLLDINGDGLPDWLVYDGDVLPDWLVDDGDSDGDLKVYLNTGNGFSTIPFLWANVDALISSSTIPLPWEIIIDELLSGSTKGLISSSTISFGGGAYFTIPIGPLCLVGCYIIINPGGDYTRTLTRVETDIQDVNGDGFVDLIFSNDEKALSVAPNQIGKTNLLKSVERPLGATITLEYEREGNTYDMPDSRWVLSKVILFDGQENNGVDEQVTSFMYEGGYYDRREREFFGFEKVVTQYLESTDGPVYRKVVEKFDIGNYYKRGLLLQEITADGSGNKYVETDYTYELRDILDGNGDAVIRVQFPALVNVIQNFYEGAADYQKSTYKTYDYDSYGNQVYIKDGADAGSQDDVEIAIGYFLDVENYIVGKADSLIITANGEVMRHQEMAYEASSGNLIGIEVFLANGEAAVTEYEYDEFGNVATVVEPENYKKERYTLTYEYDAQVDTYITKITDSFGYISETDYHLLYGLVTLEKDVNGNETRYEYDGFGRIISIEGPYEITENSNGQKTLQYIYHPEAPVPWALVQQIDSYRDKKDPIETVVFMDGLRRVIQIKKDASIYMAGAGSSQDHMIVSGATEFDFLGRPVKQWYPITEPKGQEGEYNSGVDEIKPTVTTYDVLDRTTSITIPDDTVTFYEYGFGQDRNGDTQFVKVVIDANGIPKEIFRDVRGLTTALKEYNDNGNQVIWTSYGYDPLQQIVRVTDDQGNSTEIGYDNLGRRIYINSPDSGLTETIYDLASNVTQLVTSTLRDEGEAIQYEYEYNRLLNISYPKFPENNVTFTYGEPGTASNRANRIVTMQDESGSEEFFYGPLGEITKTIKIVASDTQGKSRNSPERYITEYEYDTWNRLHTLTYPDGEVITYEYDSGGLLKSISGVKAKHKYEYLKVMGYDKFEAQVYSKLGNGISTSYTYNPLNRMLEVIQAGKGAKNARLFQDLHLVWDNVGNLIKQQNLAPVKSPNQIGGKTEFLYEYDDLNRLIHAEGTFDSQPRKRHIYSLDISYDTLHNITAKNQSHHIQNPSGQLVEQHGTTYSWEYTYTDGHPHATTQIGAWLYSFDGNGNQTGWEHEGNGTRRSILWDEENRIQSISNNGQTITYKYNAVGERVIKRGPQGETVYVNPFFTIRNREVGIKHIYANGVRIASKLMCQDKPGANPRGKVPVEKDQYFYHYDHLGSTNFVSNASGQLFGHWEYFPFGEIFIEETSNTQRTPYLFTAKEFDEETELYYFGARYYDPRISIWLSPDPILSAYLPSASTPAHMLGNGGVFNSRNLQLYGYAEQNPGTLVDFDGLAPGRFYKLITWFKGLFKSKVVAAAERAQLEGGYYVDEWTQITLPKGHMVVTGLKWQGAFYADYESVKDLVGIQGQPSAKKYYSRVQVRKAPYKNFRPFIGIFELKKEVTVAMSTVKANPDYGERGATQYYIPSWKEAIGKRPTYMKFTAIGSQR